MLRKGKRRLARRSREAEIGVEGAAGEDGEDGGRDGIVPVDSDPTGAAVVGGDGCLTPATDDNR